MEDIERNNGSPEKPYFMSRGLQKLLRKGNVASWVWLRSRCRWQRLSLATDKLTVTLLPPLECCIVTDISVFLSSAFSWDSFSLGFSVQLDFFLILNLCYCFGLLFGVLMFTSVWPWLIAIFLTSTFVCVCVFFLSFWIICHKFTFENFKLGEFKKKIM